MATPSSATPTLCGGSQGSPSIDSPYCPALASPCSASVSTSSVTVQANPTAKQSVAVSATEKSRGETSGDPSMSPEVHRLLRRSLVEYFDKQKKKEGERRESDQDKGGKERREKVQDKEKESGDRGPTGQRGLGFKRPFGVMLHKLRAAAPSACLSSLKSMSTSKSAAVSTPSSIASPASTASSTPSLTSTASSTSSTTTPTMPSSPSSSTSMSISSPSADSASPASAPATPSAVEDEDEPHTKTAPSSPPLLSSKRRHSEVDIVTSCNSTDGAKSDESPREPCAQRPPQVPLIDIHHDPCFVAPILTLQCPDEEDAVALFYARFNRVPQVMDPTKLQLPEFEYVVRSRQRRLEREQALYRREMKALRKRQKKAARALGAAAAAAGAAVGIGTGVVSSRPSYVRDHCKAERSTFGGASPPPPPPPPLSPPPAAYSS